MIIMVTLNQTPSEKSKRKTNWLRAVKQTIVDETEYRKGESKLIIKRQNNTKVNNKKNTPPPLKKKQKKNYKP